MEIGKIKIDDRAAKREIDYQIHHLGRGIISRQVRVGHTSTTMSCTVGRSLKNERDFIVFGLTPRKSEEVLDRAIFLETHGELSLDFSMVLKPGLSPKSGGLLDTQGIVYIYLTPGNSCALLPLHGLPGDLDVLSEMKEYKGQLLASKLCQIVFPDENDRFPWNGGKHFENHPILADIARPTDDGVEIIEWPISSLRLA